MKPDDRRYLFSKAPIHLKVQGVVKYLPKPYSYHILLLLILLGKIMETVTHIDLLTYLTHQEVVVIDINMRSKL